MPPPRSNPGRPPPDNRLPLHSSPPLQAPAVLSPATLEQRLQLLIESVPNPARKMGTPATKRRAADIPLWTDKSVGCPFVSRCPRATAICNVWRIHHVA